MLGSLADWSTTVVAVGAFIVASIAARATIQTNRAQQQTLELQRKEFNTLQEQTKREQASKVAFWAANGKDGALSIQVINTSDAPVFTVTFLSANENPGKLLASFPVLLKTGDKEVAVRFPQVGVHKYSAYRVKMYFIDTAGVRWVRDWFGHLKEMTNDDAEFHHAAVTAASPQEMTDMGRQVEVIE
jgi:hypothetical protein